MNARKTHLTTIIKLTGVASLVLFVGATAPKQPAVTAAAKPVPAVKIVAQSAAKPVAPAELLHDAVPAAAVIAPSAPTVRVLRMEVTAYCPCTKCCGPNAQGITASGHDVSYNNSKFVAADTAHLPFGTKLIIPGYDAAAVEVIDRGGAIKGMKLDLYYPTHEEALQWGRQWVDVVVVD